MDSKKDRRQNCSEEDRRLFLEALGEERDSSEKQVEQKESTSEFLEALEGSIAQNPEFHKKKLAAEQGKSLQAKPRSSIEARLDLHAATLELALRRTEEFLLRCHLKRFRRVLVIHGKGSGVLRDGVRRFLEHHPHVAQIAPANKSEGGDGAVVVILRR